MSAPPDPMPIVREWLNIADDDLGSAKDLASSEHWRQACFLSQQAVEKYIKALLTSRQILFERTHDIESLACLLSDAQTLELMRYDVLDLSEYAVDTRYPGSQASLIDCDDASRAISAATHVSQVIHKILTI